MVPELESVDVRVREAFSKLNPAICPDFIHPKPIEFISPVIKRGYGWAKSVQDFRRRHRETGIN